MECFLVTHTHWDREWYRTFQAFRARLVDTIDAVLERFEADPGFHFLLDGQTIVLEDYLEIRPQRRADLERACRDGRLAIGPWYVQPDSLLPSGEAHVRNLLEGRRVGQQFGPLSQVAYTPDSFGHPAQFPQLFSAFGLAPFVYWRGNGDEIDALPAEYLWEAPDGTSIMAHHLWEGYFSAGMLPTDPEAAASWLERVGGILGDRTRTGRILLMNGFDHAFPSAHSAAVAAALTRRTGWTVHRALLDDFARGLPATPARFRGELLGARIASLLPGVWSTRTSLKLRNRRAEMLLTHWAEPWSAVGRALGLGDERPALRVAWRALLQNQAHDSICGCSQDRVHEQMAARYDTAEELGGETTRRVLERLAGLDRERATPWAPEMDLAVFNPSPHVRTDVARFVLDPTTWVEFRGESTRELAVHPLLSASLTAEGWDVDGQPAVVRADDPTRYVQLIPDHPPRCVEFVARDVPAFGWRRFRLRPGASHPPHADAGTEIEADALRVSAAADGTLTVRGGTRIYAGLCGVEDVGDRGDTYDFDPVPGEPVGLTDVSIRRGVYHNGIQVLTVVRTFSVPAALAAGRDRRADEHVVVVLETEARVVPGVPRVDLRVRLDNRARDHRLRLLFPTGAPVDAFEAATTFDIARRQTKAAAASRWVHGAPTTFPHQGFVRAHGLTVGAPGLAEAEVTPDGVIAITLLRAVGWLARVDLQSRPQPAGPSVETPDAQCLGELEASLALFCDSDERAVQDAELGLWTVVAGAQPHLAADRALVEIAPPEVLLSALKPAESGPGIVLRLLNPTAAPIDTRLRVGFPFRSVTTVRLDETPEEGTVVCTGADVSVRVGPHALRSLLIEP